MKSIEINEAQMRITCEKKMGGCLLSVYDGSGDDIRRLYDQPKLREIIENIEALSQFDLGHKTVRVDFSDTERLAKFLERFL